MTETQLGDLERADTVFKNYMSYYSNRIIRRGGGAEKFILTSIVSELMTNLPVSLVISEFFRQCNLSNKQISLYHPFKDHQILVFLILKQTSKIVYSQ